MIDTFLISTREDFSRVRELPRNALEGQVFRGSGGASECDGGEYIQHVQIRVDDLKTGQVFISIIPEERHNWWSLILQWAEFADMMHKAVAAHPKAKKH